MVTLIMNLGASERYLCLLDIGKGVASDICSWYPVTVRY